jgi:hypothetical protein
MPDTGPYSRTGVTLGGLSALLAFFAANSGAIEWTRDFAAGFVHWPQLRAMLVGIGIGAAFSAWVPYVFGQAMCAERARMWMRFGSSAITFTAAWSLQPTRLGLFYALLAGLAGAQVTMTATRWLYKAFPALEPPALRS